MAFNDIVTKNIRLIILRELNESSGYTSNNSVLHMVLTKWGVALSRDRIRTELDWLGEQGYVAIMPLGEANVRVTLTPRGIDVASGHVIVDGVQRPSPSVG